MAALNACNTPDWGRFSFTDCALLGLCLCTSNQPYNVSKHRLGHCKVPNIIFLLMTAQPVNFLRDKIAMNMSYRTISGPEISLDLIYLMNFAHVFHMVLALVYSKLLRYRFVIVEQMCFHSVQIIVFLIQSSIHHHGGSLCQAAGPCWAHVPLPPTPVMGIIGNRSTAGEGSLIIDPPSPLPLQSLVTRSTCPSWAGEVFRKKCRLR